MGQTEINPDREAVSKRPSAIEYLDSIRQAKGLYVCPKPCPEVISGEPCTYCHNTPKRAE